MTACSKASTTMVLFRASSNEKRAYPSDSNGSGTPRNVPPSGVPLEALKVTISSTGNVVLNDGSFLEGLVARGPLPPWSENTMGYARVHITRRRVSVIVSGLCNVVVDGVETLAPQNSSGCSNKHAFLLSFVLGTDVITTEQVFGQEFDCQACLTFDIGRCSCSCLPLSCHHAFLERYPWLTPRDAVRHPAYSRPMRSRIHK